MRRFKLTRNDRQMLLSFALFCSLCVSVFSFFFYNNKMKVVYHCYGQTICSFSTVKCHKNIKNIYFNCTLKIIFF